MNPAASVAIDNNRGSLERVKSARRLRDKRVPGRAVRRRSMRLTVLALLIWVLDRPR